jgi:uncharacterized protein YerC
MSKLSRKPLDPKDMGYYVNNLWNSFTLMGSKEEVREFVKDLFTHTEYKMLAKRLEIARRLLKGETYESIKDSLKVTEKPIVYISNILANAGKGFRNVDLRLQDLEKEYSRKREERQAYIEHRKRRKLPAETFLGNVVGAGVKALDKAVTKKIKITSVTKQLPL